MALPLRVPFSLARFMPADTRSRIMARSNSANTEQMRRGCGGSFHQQRT